MFNGRCSMRGLITALVIFALVETAVAANMDVPCSRCFFVYTRARVPLPDPCMRQLSHAVGAALPHYVVHQKERFIESQQTVIAARSNNYCWMNAYGELDDDTRMPVLRKTPIDGDGADDIADTIEAMRIPHYPDLHYPAADRRAMSPDEETMTMLPAIDKHVFYQSSRGNSPICGTTHAYLFTAKGKEHNLIGRAGDTQTVSSTRFYRKIYGHCPRRASQVGNFFFRATDVMRAGTAIKSESPDIRIPLLEESPGPMPKGYHLDRKHNAARRRGYEADRNDDANIVFGRSLKNTSKSGVTCDLYGFSCKRRELKVKKTNSKFLLGFANLRFQGHVHGWCGEARRTSVNSMLADIFEIRSQLHDPCNLGGITRRRPYRVMCLARCSAATQADGTCASHSSSRWYASITERARRVSRCAPGSVTTPSGYCRCGGAAGTTFGRGCDIHAEIASSFDPKLDDPVATIYDALDAISDRHSSTTTGRKHAGSEMCRLYGSGLCSGEGRCVADVDSPAARISNGDWPFACHCAGNFTGTPDTPALYAATMEAQCRDPTASSASVDEDDFNRLAATRQCLFYAGRAEEEANYVMSSDGTNGLSGTVAATPAVEMQYDPTTAGDVRTIACSEEGHGGPGCLPCRSIEGHKSPASVHDPDRVCDYDRGYCVGSSSRSHNNCACKRPQEFDRTSSCTVRFCPYTHVSGTAAAGFHDETDACGEALGRGRCARDADRLDDVVTRNISVAHGNSLVEEFTRACVCADGWTGPACSVRACPFAPDPLACEYGGEDATNCTDVVCGGHGTCDEESGSCMCATAWLPMTPENGYVVDAEGSNVTRVGACLFRQCPVDDNGLQCGGLVHGRADDPLFNTSVCDHHPLTPKCHCFSALADPSGVPETVSGLENVHWGDHCQHTFAETCENACHGNGFCLACDSQRAGFRNSLTTAKDCDGTPLNREPSCSCKDSLDRKKLCDTDGHGDMQECLKPYKPFATEQDSCHTTICNNYDGCDLDHSTAPFCTPSGPANDRYHCHCAWEEGNRYGGDRCDINMTSDDHPCLTNLTAGISDPLECGGFGRCAVCESTDSDPTCSLGESHFCRCDTGRHGRGCATTGNCDASCDGIGCCECALSSGDCSGTTAAADFKCVCAHRHDGGSFAGNVAGTCGDDRCNATGGIYHGGSVHRCDCGEGSVWDDGDSGTGYHGCRLPCPGEEDSTVFPCGYKTSLGVSRCNIVTSRENAINPLLVPTCDCSAPGYPDHAATEWVASGDTEAEACTPLCVHCYQTASGICNVDADGCAAADRSVNPDGSSGPCQWHGDRCDEHRCSLHGTWNGTACECDLVSEGDNCEVTKCSGAGSAADMARPNTCACVFPFGPTDTGGCASRCKNNGVANTTSGTCECTPGHTGPLCENDACDSHLGRTGSECTCDPKLVFTGALCNESACENGGTPNTLSGSTRCDCPGAYSGPGDRLCQTSVCANGVPTANGTECICNDGWDHADSENNVGCTVSRCGTVDPTPCDDASCNNGYRCDCGPAHSDNGASCVARAGTGNPCNGHGHLLPGAGGCVCELGWNGTTCEDDPCDMEANPRITMNSTTGLCECKAPWSGLPACEEHTCGMWGCVMAERSSTGVSVISPADDEAAIDASILDGPNENLTTATTLDEALSPFVVFEDQFASKAPSTTWVVANCRVQTNLSIAAHAAEVPIVLGRDTRWYCSHSVEATTNSQGSIVRSFAKENTLVEATGTDDPVCVDGFTGPTCHGMIPIETTTPSDEEMESSGLSGAEIVLIVLGVLAGVAVVGYVAMRNKDKIRHSASPDGDGCCAFIKDCFGPSQNFTAVRST